MTLRAERICRETVRKALLQKNILATFYSGNKSIRATIPCVASEFLQQSQPLPQLAIDWEDSSADAHFFLERTPAHRRNTINYGMNMLGACAAAREIDRQEQFEEWLTGNGLDDPGRFMPALSSSLEAMVGENEDSFY